MFIPGNGKTLGVGSGIPICPSPRSPACVCGSDSASNSINCAAAPFQSCPSQGNVCFGFCKPSGACTVGKTALNQPTWQVALNNRRASPHCLRLPSNSRLFLIIFVFLMTPNPLSILQWNYANDRASSPSSWGTETVPSSLFYRVLERISRGSLDSFGPIFASAAQCAVNICNSGTCYEHGTAQICVCPLPFKGPTCAEKASLCVDDCGIRTNSGLDCQSALCSLGACVDTDVFPFFKCECGDFFQGTNCEVPSNPCTGAVNPCGQGTCVFAAGKGTGTVTCQCHDDWEVAPGVGVVTTKWGNSEVVMNPPCSVRVSRGLANIPFTLSSGELVFWWTVFATAICFLLWCCYTVAAESCGSCLRKFKIAGQMQKAAGA